MLNKGTVLSERYEIIERIGSGGMADVYRAMDHKLNRYVAIKVLKREFREDKQFVAKFRQEARAVAGLSHPNIVNVYDVGNEGQIYYMILELVEGITLKKYIEKKGHLPYKEAVSIAIQVANGIEAAHAHHIVHRDIKPQNIIISKEGKVKVTDFGIAKATSATTTVSTAAMGSVHYMSPEQARGGYSDERSDIYSFGITFFEMLTGQVPFDGDSTVAVAVHHIQDEIKVPSELIAGIPLSVDRIVQKCTRKKVDLRYQNMEELIADLKKSLLMPDVDFVQMGTAASAAGSSALGGETTVLGGQKQKADPARKPAADTKDIEDSGNGRFNGILKWVGIGIAAIIVIIIVIFSVRYATTGSITGKSDSKETTVAKVTIPDVKGKGVDEAVKTLRDAGFLVSVASDKGIVTKMDPEAGTSVDKGSTVTLSLTTETTTTTQTTIAKVTVPEVLGLYENEAFAAIEAKNLKYSVSYETSDTVEWLHVIRVTPGVGTEIEQGKTVSVVISSGKKKTTKATVPDVKGKTFKEAVSLIKAEGLECQYMTDKLPDDNARVTDQNPKAGKVVEFNTDDQDDEKRVVQIQFANDEKAEKTTPTTNSTKAAP
ncbi:MAG: Stk1 family PASTA domain-containing Ser/Thr kinase [Clostridiales bacterium]|nr:Stk1 family PASTA domain-containing Ser/Thr kinase [Clostridiales bacterium]MBS5877980.1 Stk1 family PASTA domain-containing Ser/Thr kinase [Clostridiales bacterium]MDU0939874.1 Stk1 family PASTA domain-containing Ser/Thr kinase [Clostridiales bacterium]MDU1042444.1 Stk1 family PASTA domain-containing Ser/Thr kinase [Clostridiales bacterium]MDU3490030.1 Stk1 family PASTA domain-containing Ser/Thr kinase [Clostridiales bacterium]